MKYLTIALVLCILPLSTMASSQHHKHSSNYIGEHNRSIKSLSADDIEKLKSGAGWGLAKPAELNGVPGPAHLLELKNEIPLTDEQTEAISNLYQHMKEQAQELGASLVDKEMKLEMMFQKRNYTKDMLLEILNDIGMVRSQLRYVHLSKHIDAAELLTIEQVKNYNLLRGYGNTKHEKSE